jgi:hypothetical protein
MNLKVQIIETEFIKIAERTYPSKRPTGKLTDGIVVQFLQSDDGVRAVVIVGDRFRTELIHNLIFNTQEIKD